MKNYILQEDKIKKIKEVCKPIIPLRLLKNMALVEFYTEEPPLIEIKKEAQSTCEKYEQIFRLKIYIPNKTTISYMIYSKEREIINEEQEIIVRSVIWDIEKDIVELKKNKGDNVPNINFKITYISKNNAISLINDIKHIDKMISNGIVLKERKENEEKTYWKDIQVRRIYNWGSVYSTWSNDMENRELEIKCEELLEKMPIYMKSQEEELYQLELDYTYPPSEYRKIIYG